MTTSKRRIPINTAEQADAGVVPEAPVAPGSDPGSEASIASAGAPEVAATEVPAEVPESEASEQGAQEASDLAAERDRLAAECEALADALLRLRAKFDNFRKRMSRELIESRERARGDLLSELLPVLDNLDRALDAAEHHDEGKVLTGVRMTRDMFADLLRRSGVEEVETVGAPFDPTVHEAVAVQASSEPEGTVMGVVERGYRQGNRVLRPARVVVSAGQTATAAGADADGDK